MTVDPEEHELIALIERLPPVHACRVVEIGCGDGRLTRRYRGRVGSVVAIDTDEGAIAALRANWTGADVDARVSSIDDLNLPDASVDTVLLSWSL
jgi:ubiquinone/menaquinone biosynthesis C-methylase UbiE